MYVAVKGGEAAIANAHRLLARERRGDPDIPLITAAQVAQQLTLAVDRVMAEGSLYDADLAAIAIGQARGDLIEAIFLVRAYRTTLARLGASEPVDTGEMRIRRRVSATFKDLPGGQILGPTFDYTHRLIEPDLSAPEPAVGEPAGPAPRVTDVLGSEGLIEPDFSGVSGGAADAAAGGAADGAAGGAAGGAADAAASGAAGAAAGDEPGDLTRTPLDFPLGRDVRLQALARGDEGWLLGMAYSTQRGFGRTHPFVGEIRMGEVEVELFVPELGFAVSLGEITVTECQMVNQFKGSTTEPAQFTRGYGLVFGRIERKAMSMALVDRALRAGELGEDRVAPAQDEEFVIAHADNVQATGFVEHLKLPHYVDFQAELALVRELRAEQAAGVELQPEPAE